MIDNSELSQNSGLFGGAIELINMDSDISATTFSSNQAEQSGGAIQLKSAFHTAAAGGGGSFQRAFRRSAGHDLQSGHPIHVCQRLRQHRVTAGL